MPGKYQLFEQGVAAAARALNLIGVFPCPTCGIHFDKNDLESGHLTLEHVPPESLGGTAIILTCKACNNTAGHTIDAEAASRQTLSDFQRTILHGVRGSAGRGRITWGDQILNAEISVGDDDTTDLKVLGESNNPASVNAAAEFMHGLRAAGKTDGYKFQVTSAVRFNPRLARISDLRSAFLALCAKFGYCYAFNSSLDSVREQIHRPAQEILSVWWGARHPDAPERRITVFETDGIVSVALSNQTIFLPWPSRDVSEYLRLMAQMADNNTIRLGAHRHYAWPQSFEAIIDRNIHLLSGKNKVANGPVTNDAPEAS